MKQKGYRRAHVARTSGFQHGRDDYWFQPLVFGANLFTYLASVPPGGTMPPHGHEEDPYELSFYQLDGTMHVTLEHDTFTVKPGDAVHVDPGVSLGVHNRSRRVARFLLTFNPPPLARSLEAMHERYVSRGGGMKSAEEMQRMITQGRKTRRRTSRR
jgi:quercetin dioxygenase-like cupin family protein